MWQSVLGQDANPPVLRSGWSTLSCLSCIECADLQEHYQYKTPFPYWSMRHPHSPASCMNVSHVSLTVLALWTPPWTGTWVKNQTVWWEWNPWWIARMWNAEAFFFFFFELLTQWRGARRVSEHESVHVNIRVDVNVCVRHVSTRWSSWQWTVWGWGGGERQRRHWNDVTQFSSCVSIIK